jgi:hypothetical protein
MSLDTRFTMDSMLRRCAIGLSAALALGMPVWTVAQQQTGARGDWPCGARLDPSYFQLAEGTGGHLYLLAPWEIGDSAPLLIAFGNHPQTIYRMAGSIKPGVHEFRVPIDSSVESVLFSISVQCLQTGEITRPSGVTLVPGEGVTDYSNFRAQRMMLVKRPEPGIWTVRASGSGLAGVVVQARTDLTIDSVQFAAAGSTAFTFLPVREADNSIRIDTSGRATEVHASLVDASFRRIASLPRSGDEEGYYVSRFSPVQQPFRVLIEGKTVDGAPFQRLHAPLFSPTR